MTRPELVIWDIDRTLLDAGPVSHEIFVGVLNDLGGTIPGEADKTMTGSTDQALIRAGLAAGGVSAERLDALASRAAAQLVIRFQAEAERIRAEGRVLPGVRSVLGRLAAMGVHQTVLTGCLHANALFKLDLFDLTEFLDTEAGAYGDESQSRIGLVPLAMARVRRRLRREVPPCAGWLIGDTPGDLECARVAGLRCVLVATGLYDAAELSGYGADYVLADFSDTAAVLKILSGHPGGDASFDDLLAAWGPGARAGPPRPGQHSIEVRTVTVDGSEYIGRRSLRPPDEVEWELAVLDYLSESGVMVPTALPTREGERQSGGLVLTRKLAGGHPSTPEDWRQAAEQAACIHALTVGWPQRPGEMSFREYSLTAGATSALVRAGGQLGEPDGVIVGRTRRHDITMTERGPVFVDWDRARVDSAVFDFACGDIPPGYGGFAPAQVRAAIDCARFHRSRTEQEA